MSVQLYLPVPGVQPGFVPMTDLQVILGHGFSPRLMAQVNRLHAEREDAGVVIARDRGADLVVSEHTAMARTHRRLAAMYEELDAALRCACCGRLTDGSRETRHGTRAARGLPEERLEVDMYPDATDADTWDMMYALAKDTGRIGHKKSQKGHKKGGADNG